MMRPRCARSWPQGALLCLAVFASSCGGASASGGTAGSEALLPNCRADAPAIARPKDERWMFAEGRPFDHEPSGRYLIEVTPDGPRGVVRVGEEGGFVGWSADGRFLAITRSDESPALISIIDVSQGLIPAPVAVLPRAGKLSWSRSDARYALLVGENQTFESLVIVDAATTAETIVGIPPNLHDAHWSWDGRYVAVVGSSLLLVDTSETELALRTVFDGHSYEPLFSGDGRHLAFVSDHPDGDRLYLFDPKTQTLELVVDAGHYSVTTSFAWSGNTSLVVRLDERAFFVDLTERPFALVPLAELAEPSALGEVSPGNKCYTYRGTCDATGEAGLCVKTLPPDAASPSVLLEHGEFSNWRPEWAGTGDQLLLREDSEPWLINVELDGGSLTNRVLTDGIETRQVYQGYLPTSFNPSGSSDWVAYVASPEEEYVDLRPRLWNRETGETFDVFIGDMSMVSVAWSSDGRYLFVHSDGAFYVQEVLERELGRNWRVSGLDPAAEAEVWALNWQP